MMTVFWPIFVTRTKIILDYNIEAPLTITQNSQRNTCARVFFNKVARPKPETLLK